MSIARSAHTQQVPHIRAKWQRNSKASKGMQQKGVGKRYLKNLATGPLECMTNKECSVSVSPQPASPKNLASHSISDLTHSTSRTELRVQTRHATRFLHRLHIRQPTAGQKTSKSDTTENRNSQGSEKN